MRPIDCIHSEAAHHPVADAWRCASCGIIVSGKEAACVRLRDETEKKAAVRAMRIQAGSEVEY